uniref:Uncharacterized protein n=1 Tax=Cacopsylla melanoneura TaxID=428564 RepID=A0A8D9EI96_9HEMI
MVCNRKLPVTVRIPVTLPYCVILPTLRPGRLVFEFFTLGIVPTSYINRIEVGRYIKSSEFKKYLLNVLLLIIFFSEIYHVMEFVHLIFCLFVLFFVVFSCIFLQALKIIYLLQTNLLKQSYTNKNAFVNFYRH